MKQTKFIIFGASGDLAKKRLFPALFDLCANNIKFNGYIGYGRTELGNEQFKELIKNSLAHKKISPNDLSDFLSGFKYVSGQYCETGLEKLKKETGGFKTIFYLAIPTSYELVKEILLGLRVHGLIKEDTKIVLEKPFGGDFKSAVELNKLILKYLKEKQIYRIDHYLAKDLVRDLLTIRFANTIFKPLWNNKYIESIEIKIKENIGIGNRGEFYDQAGAIRDIIQNHALQLLALTTMNQPANLSSFYIHEEKNKILKNLRLFSKDKISDIQIGQYQGYLNEEHVKKDSLTETFASLRARINLPAWRGVPVILTTGKKMDEQTTDIVIKFKNLKKCLWGEGEICRQNNQLTFNVQPKNDIQLKLNFGFDSFKKTAKTINLKFGFLENEFLLKDAYEHALLDLYNNDQSLFLDSKEILLSWKFIDPIIALIDKHRKDMLKIY